MLVGDIVQAIREAITDQPQTLSVPIITSMVAATTAGATLTPGTYFIQVTATNQWGETTPTAEESVTLSGGQNAIDMIVVSPPGTVNVNVYIGYLGAGTETSYLPIPAASNGVVNVTTGGTVPSAPPTRNTAYLPDTNGDSFSAWTLFNWVNDCLTLASAICGGLIDYSGVQTQVGQPMYVINGKWESIPDVWYDGYPLMPDKSGNFFRRNSITASVLTQVATTLLTDRMMLEVWPQPARSGSSTTLSSGMTAIQTNAPATNIGGFLLTDGMIQVDSEMMAYNGQSANTFQNLIRGLGGTIAVPHNVGAPVLELNLFFHGWRSFQINYQPGQATSTVFIPDDWSPLMPIYGLARVKLAEQDVQGYQALKKDFETSLTSWFKQNMVTTGPKQIGDVGNQLEVTYNLGGGWVIP
jgi:hypothetical protein